MSIKFDRKSSLLLKVIAFVFLTSSVEVLASSSVSELTEKQNFSAYRSGFAGPKNLVSMDGFPVLLGGLGLGFDRLLTPAMSLGIFASSYTVKLESEATYTLKTRFAGARGRYFLTGESSANGLYLGLALVNANISSLTQIAGGYEDGVSSDTKTGFLGSIGYQLLGRDFGSGKMIINLAVLAGTGLSGKTQTSGNPFTKKTESTTTIGTGLGAEATLGYLF